ncbi:MAG: non-canonical purine NTP phosphatase [Bacteroidia bacterium]|nr:non-canonical purine NTP phosphatase [Bacteroidia bacterium]
MKVVVASKNPVKLQAVQEGFQSFFEGVEVFGIEVESGVSDQPLSDAETLKGARNRAQNAMEQMNDAGFWVGVEGGIEPAEKGLAAFAWIVILSKEKYGEARTTSFLLPPEIAGYIEQGYELGVANDKVFQQNNSKQKQGAVGLLTRNEVNRTQLYVQAVKLALIPFINPDLF